jgi:hypothetical protein
MQSKATAESQDGFATVERVMQAVAELTVADYLRLRKTAKYLMGGSAYQDPDQLVQDAVTTPLFAAAGGGGRRWQPSRVSFVIFLGRTIQGLASDSRRVRKRRLLLSIVAGSAARDYESVEPQECNLLDTQQFATPSVEQTAVDEQEDRDRQREDDLLLARVHEHFKRDLQTMTIIAGIKEGNSAHQIREQAGMSETQYASARRRFRRGLEHLFPGQTKL